MYSKTSLKKYVDTMKSAIAFFDSLELNDIHVTISKGNRKIGQVMNVSIPAILTCGKNGKYCKGICYDIKACLQYKNVIAARAKNYSILKRDRNKFFSEIDAAMSRRRKNKFFRFHVAGDIIDIDYLDRMVNLALLHPDFKIWTYTKQYNIVNEYLLNNNIPANLTIMFSEWRGLEMVNPFEMPEFRVVFKDDIIKPSGFYCPGNCDICKFNNTGCINNMTTYCNEH